MSGGHDLTPANGNDGPRLSLGEKLRKAIMKPEIPGAPGEWNEPQTVEELELAVNSANDKERLIGLIAAPLAAIIAFLINASEISNDPPAIKNGHINTLHTNPSLYNELLLVMLALAVLMLVLSMLRKRLFIGIVMALYGLAVFNLKFWGFGIPFILAGAWYLVRAYRLQRDLKEATGGTSGGPPGRRSSTANNLAPRANKRYTPPTASRRWSTKPAKEPRVG